jgi:hypothetical protein
MRPTFMDWCLYTSPCINVTIPFTLDLRLSLQTNGAVFAGQKRLVLNTLHLSHPRAAFVNSNSYYLQ